MWEGWGTCAFLRRQALLRLAHTHADGHSLAHTSAGERGQKLAHTASPGFYSQPAAAGEPHLPPQAALVGLQGGWAVGQPVVEELHVPVRVQQQAAGSGEGTQVLLT